MDSVSSGLRWVAAGVRGGVSSGVTAAAAAADSAGTAASTAGVTARHAWETRVRRRVAPLAADEVLTAQLAAAGRLETAEADVRQHVARVAGLLAALADETACLTAALGAVRRLCDVDGSADRLRSTDDAVTHAELESTLTRSATEAAAQCRRAADVVRDCAALASTNVAALQTDTRATRLAVDTARTNLDLARAALAAAEAEGGSASGFASTAAAVAAARAAAEDAARPYTAAVGAGHERMAAALQQAAMGTAAAEHVFFSALADWTAQLGPAAQQAAAAAQGLKNGSWIARRLTDERAEALRRHAADAVDRFLASRGGQPIACAPTTPAEVASTATIVATPVVPRPPPPASPQTPQPDNAPHPAAGPTTQVTLDDLFP